jgi:hypothetical protein
MQGSKTRTGGFDVAIWVCLENSLVGYTAPLKGMIRDPVYKYISLEASDFSPPRFVSF